MLDAVVCSSVCPCPIPSIVVEAWIKRTTRTRLWLPVSQVPAMVATRKGAGARQRRCSPAGEAGPGASPPGRDAEPGDRSVPLPRLADACGALEAAGPQRGPSSPLPLRPRDAVGDACAPVPSAPEPRAGEQPASPNCLFSTR